MEGIGEAIPNELVSHDQTILNAVGEGQFTRIGNRYNNAWFAGMKLPAYSENTIIQFIGSPKPWYILGHRYHKGYNSWSAFNTKFWKSEYGKSTMAKLKRGWRIKKSLVKNIKDSLLSKNNEVG